MLKNETNVQELSTKFEKDMRTKINELQHISDRNQRIYEDLQDEVNILALLFNNYMIHHFDWTRLP